MKNETLKNKVVFVCTGNTCRSPMAEYIFRKRAAESGLDKLKVCSAGVRAKRGDGMNEKSARVLAEQGFDVLEFKARKVDKRLLKDSLAIVCMTDAQRDTLMELRWNALRESGEEEIENNVYSFSDITGYQVLDPYGRDIDCYRYVYALLSDGMAAVLDAVLPEENRAAYRKKPRAARKKKND